MFYERFSCGNLNLLNIYQCLHVTLSWIITRNIGYTLMFNVWLSVVLTTIIGWPYLPEKRVINGVNKLMCIFYDEKSYLCQTGLLKQNNL